MPSVLVRPGASDGQLLDGLSLLAPDIRQHLLTILHAMEHRDAPRTGTRRRTQPPNVGPSLKPKTFAPSRAAFPAVAVL